MQRDAAAPCSRRWKRGEPCFLSPLSPAVPDYPHIPAPPASQRSSLHSLPESTGSEGEQGKHSPFSACSSLSSRFAQRIPLPSWEQLGRSMNLPGTESPSWERLPRAPFLSGTHWRPRALLLPLPMGLKLEQAYLLPGRQQHQLVFLAACWHPALSSGHCHPRASSPTVPLGFCFVP